MSVFVIERVKFQFLLSLKDIEGNINLALLCSGGGFPNYSVYIILNVIF